MWRSMEVPRLTAQSPQSCEVGLRVKFSRQLFFFTFTCCLDDLNQLQGVKYHLFVDDLQIDISSLEVSPDHHA